MATPAIDSAVRLRPGNSADLDAVMQVMNAAFGDRFGEAWTRSQCAGILPMTGVSLVIARDCRTGETVGFSLSRSVADEAELLLLGGASEPAPARASGGVLLDDFIDRARGRRRRHAFISKSATAILRSPCIEAPVFSRSGAGATIIMRRMAAGSTR